jgi:hypothetical protein
MKSVGYLILCITMRKYENVYNFSYALSQKLAQYQPVLGLVRPQRIYAILTKLANIT